MFQTEPILWLQSWASPPLTLLLSTITLLGYTPVYVALLLVLAFARDLRASLAVLVVLLLAAVMFSGLKEALGMPRPGDLDARVRRGARLPGQPLVERGDAPSFRSLPEPAAIAAARARTVHDYGFPSGHVGAATAFLLGYGRFFRSRRALAFAAFWLPAMALSRMYLGRHFLADVIGGFLVGLLATGLALPLVRGLDASAFGDRRSRGLVPAGLVAIALLALSPFVDWLAPLYVGAFAGVVITYAFVRAAGAPRGTGSLPHRLACVTIGGAIFVLLTAAFLGGFEVGASHVGALAAGLVVTTATFAGTTVLTRRLGLA